MISSEDEADHSLASLGSFKRRIIESSDDDDKQVKRKKYPSIERIASDYHSGNIIEQVDAEDSESVKNSLPSDFEEDILSCGGNCQVTDEIPFCTIIKHQNVTAGIGNDHESYQYLYCYLCGISKPADSFSEAQQKEAELGESAYCLVHHHGSLTYSLPAPLSSDESVNHSVGSYESTDASGYSESNEWIEEISVSEDDCMHDDSPVIDFGKHKGRSYNYIFKNDYSYCTWALGVTAGPSSKLKKFQKWIRGMGVA
jgi:hypothetical protein